MAKTKQAKSSAIKKKGNNPVNDGIAQSMQKLLDNKELMLQLLDTFPVPVELFAPDGTVVFASRAFLELNKIPDVNLVLGKYNILNDPVVNDQLGLREGIRKAFKGEPGCASDFAAALPAKDLVDRNVIDDKPFDATYGDMYLTPLWDGNEIAFVLCVFIVKRMYKGRMEVIRAKEYMEQHWQGAYNAEEVAKEANMSVAALHAIFKQSEGMAPGDYHHKVKIRHIKEKLADKSLSIKEAFAACGEDSQGWILRVFKEQTGMTPMQYRGQLEDEIKILQGNETSVVKVKKQAKNGKTS